MDSKPLLGLNVCSLTTVHPPDDDRIFYKEARSLARLGANVVILHPGRKPEPKKTDGVKFATFEGSLKKLERLKRLGVVEKALIESGAELVHCHEPDALWVALRLKRSRALKVIYDSHEMWGATAAGYMPRPFWNLAEWAFKIFEMRWIAQSDGAIGASWAIADYLSSVLPRDRVETILNVPAPEVFGEAPLRQWGETTFVCHDGSLGFDRGLITMAEAIKQVAHKHKVVFKIVGDVFGAERQWLEGFIKENRLEGTIFRTGWLPYEQVGPALASCHIGLIALQEKPNNVVTSSNKVFNYMLYGIPFIGPDFRLAKQKLVREEHCGILADSTSSESYANAITQMIENRDQTMEMGHNAQRASQDKYRWPHMETRLLALYKRILNRV